MCPWQLQIVRRTFVKILFYWCRPGLRRTSFHSPPRGCYLEHVNSISKKKPHITTVLECQSIHTIVFLEKLKFDRLQKTRKSHGYTNKRKITKSIQKTTLYVTLSYVSCSHFDNRQVHNVNSLGFIERVSLFLCHAYGFHNHSSNGVYTRRSIRFVAGSRSPPFARFQVGCPLALCADKNYHDDFVTFLCPSTITFPRRGVLCCFQTFCSRNVHRIVIVRHDISVVKNKKNPPYSYAHFG